MRTHFTDSEKARIRMHLSEIQNIIRKYMYDAEPYDSVDVIGAKLSDIADELR